MITTVNVHINDTNRLITPEHLDHKKDLCTGENRKKRHIDTDNALGDSFCKVYKSLDVVKSYKAIFGKAIADFNSGKKPSCLLRRLFRNYLITIPILADERDAAATGDRTSRLWHQEQAIPLLQNLLCTG